MNTPPSRSDSDIPDAWETRVARIPLASPPPDLRRACLRAQDPRPTAFDGLAFLRVLWSSHPWAIRGLAAAWTLITALHLTTPEISVANADSHTVWAEETLQLVARQRAELMATALDWDRESAPVSDESAPPAKASDRPNTTPPTAFPTNRMS
ncbi:MAG: hypothetical protein NTX70_10125 [Verrucomicrobia bacterium]|nr:hypothetical protein [Verrucomicrobiota bacterium]